nr:MAG TPA: hypothetical protein [Caudoviricetes sp.]
MSVFVAGPGSFSFPGQRRGDSRRTGKKGPGARV